jgi:hypothetical protein
VAALTVQDGRNGLGTVTFASAAETGDTVTPGGVDAGGWQLPVVLIVVNGSGADSEVTVTGLADPVDVVAGETGIIPLRSGAVHGRTIAVAYENHETITVAAVRLW